MDDEIRIIPDTAVPDGVSQDVRTLLVETGIPRGVGETIGIPHSVQTRIPTLSEFYRTYGEMPPEGTAHLYSLGFCGPWRLAFDGSSGCVFVVNRKIGTCQISTSVDQFVEFMCVMNSELTCLAEVMIEDEAAHVTLTDDIVRRVLERVQRIDPEGFAAGAQIWRDIITGVIEESTT